MTKRGQLSFTTTQREIGPTEALGMLEASPYALQRPVRNQHVAYLASAMREGTFTINTIQIARVAGCKESYLLNGQHTLWAIAEAGVTIRLPIQVYTVASEAMVGKLYASLDAGARRTMTDVARATGWDDLQSANRLAAALLLVAYNFRAANRRMDKQLVLKAAEPWTPAYESFKRIMAKSSDFHVKRAILRRGFLAVGIILYRYVPNEEVDEFWTGVATDDGLGRFDPRHQLSRYILLAAQQDARQTVSAEAEARAAALAWNKYAAGLELRSIIHGDVLPGLGLAGVDLAGVVAETAEALGLRRGG